MQFQKISFSYHPPRFRNNAHFSQWYLLLEFNKIVLISYLLVQPCLEPCELTAQVVSMAKSPVRLGREKSGMACSVCMLMEGKAVRERKCCV